MFIKTMSLMLMLCIATFGFLPTTHAQSIEGKWKRTAVILTESDGKVTDVHAMAAKALPCAAMLIYEFTANGLQKTIIPAECAKTMQVMADMYVDIKYTLVGNKLTMDGVESLELPASIYTIKFQGDVMTWDFSYTNNPKYPNPTKAKHMSIVYKKL